VIRYNLPRLKDFHLYDEVLLRSEVENVRNLGYAARNTGVLEGMAGLAVPILNRDGHAVAALSVATISDRWGRVACRWWWSCSSAKQRRSGPGSIRLIRRCAGPHRPLVGRSSRYRDPLRASSRA